MSFISEQERQKTRKVLLRPGDTDQLYPHYSPLMVSRHVLCKESKVFEMLPEKKELVDLKLQICFDDNYEIIEILANWITGCYTRLWRDFEADEQPDMGRYYR